MATISPPASPSNGVGGVPRPMSAMIRPNRSSSRLSMSSKQGGGSRASDEESSKTAVKVGMYWRKEFGPRSPACIAPSALSFVPSILPFLHSCHMPNPLFVLSTLYSLYFTFPHYTRHVLTTFQCSGPRPPPTQTWRPGFRPNSTAIPWFHMSRHFFLESGRRWLWRSQSLRFRPCLWRGH